MAHSFPKRTSENGWNAPLNQALATPVPHGQRSSLILEHGSMSVRLYSPDQIDAQSPHDQDEVYVVASGVGWFINGKHRHRFSTGDVLFVPAGVEHRFENFKDDLTVWVIFYGPRGGELSDDHPTETPYPTG